MLFSNLQFNIQSAVLKARTSWARQCVGKDRYATSGSQSGAVPQR